LTCGRRYVCCALVQQHVHLQCSCVSTTVEQEHASSGQDRCPMQSCKEHLTEAGTEARTEAGTTRKSCTVLMLTTPLPCLSIMVRSSCLSLCSLMPSRTGCPLSVTLRTNATLFLKVQTCKHAYPIWSKSHSYAVNVQYLNACNKHCVITESTGFLAQLFTCWCTHRC